MEKQKTQVSDSTTAWPVEAQELLRESAIFAGTNGQQQMLSPPVEMYSGRNRPVATIVVPVYNEEEALPLVLDALFQVLDDTYEILVVDDGSSDSSVAVAKRYPCRLVVHGKNMGKGAALRTGLEEARGDKVLFIDADNTYPVDVIPEMVGMMDEYDLVRGVRHLGRENIPFVNRMGNQVFDGVIRMLHAVDGGDLLSGLYGGCRDCLLEMALESEGFDIEAEINVKARAYGFTYATLPINYYERVGEKKLKAFQDGVRILRRVLRLTVTHNPLVVFMLPGLALFLLGVLGVGWMLIDPSPFNDPVLAMHGTLGLGVIGALGAQLMFFGLAVYAAAMAHGLCGRESPVLNRISEALTGTRVRLAGLLVGTLGFVGLIWAAALRLVSGHEPFVSPAPLVFMSLCLLFGFQMLSASAFLSAFRGLELKLSPEVGR